MKLAKTRTKLAVVCLSSMAVLLFAGLAWACTPEQYISTVRPLSGPAGSQVTIEGKGALPGVPVEIRWNGLEGLKIAETVAGRDGSFSVSTQIPTAAPEVYSIISLAPGTGVGRSVFEVTSEPLASIQANQARGTSGSQSTASDLWEGLSKPVSTSENPATATDPSASTAARGAGMASMALGLAALSAALTLPFLRKSRAGRIPS